MINVRRLIPLCPKQVFLLKRFYSEIKGLTDEENRKLYEKLVPTKFNEKNVEASTFAKWVTPHIKFGPPRIMAYDWSIRNIGTWYGRKRTEFHKYNQRYIPDRVKALGSDIAAAHFMVYRGGAIRFRNHDNFIKWTNQKEEYNEHLPNTYDPNYFVEAIDTSSLLLYYEGLENFKNLYKLKWLRLKNNPVLDNWSLDYIGYAIPQLEYLDISDCPRVTAAGIAGLQKLTQLKQLVINSNDVEIQMACFALEDTIPELFVSIEGNDTDRSKLQKKENQLYNNELS